MDYYFEDAYYKSKSYEVYKTLNPLNCNKSEKVVLDAEKQWKLTEDEIINVFGLRNSVKRIGLVRSSNILQWNVIQLRNWVERRFCRYMN